MFLALLVCSDDVNRLYFHVASKIPAWSLMGTHISELFQLQP